MKSQDVSRPCSRCGHEHSRKSPVRWHSYCLDCHREVMREWRQSGSTGPRVCDTKKARGCDAPGQNSADGGREA